MEVDASGWQARAGEESGDETPRSASFERDKFAYMKAFVSAAREFQATHSDTSVTLMSRNLGLVASSCDLSMFSPGRSEVCAFFGSLWRVMADGRAPHWAAVSVLSRAAEVPSARHALTHTFKFLPILARLLSDTMPLDKKMRLLSLMQDISYGIKISWQEAYLPGLLALLTEWVSREGGTGAGGASGVGRAALTLLVNLCHGNLPAVYTLQRTVDTKHFVTRLISMKEDGYGGVEVCRLLLCLSGSVRHGGPAHQHVHSYVACATNTMHKAVMERDPTQLLHTHMFLNDLCSNTSLKSHMLTYPDFATPIAEVIKESLELCSGSPVDGARAKAEQQCLEHVLNSLNLLTNLELFSLRCLHSSLLELSLRANHYCLAASLQLFTTVLSQYREDGRLPSELSEVVSEGVPGLMAAPTLEPGTVGLPWLGAVGALCDCSDVQERLLRNLTPAAFEETLFSVLHHSQQNGPAGLEHAQQTAVVGCRAALSLAPLSREWDAALARLLAHHQVCKLLSSCLSGGGGGVAGGERRRQVLQLIKHPHFPPDKINQVFGGEVCSEATSSAASCGGGGGGGAECGALGGGGGGGEEWGAGAALLPAHEQALDRLIERLSRALDGNQITDIATSSVMELYAYKMSCLEQRLHSHTTALQAASEHTGSLQHTLALLQATHSQQQDVLYTTQIQNEKHKANIEHLSGQLGDAEKSLRGFRAKLAAERLDRENQISSLANAHRAQINTLESEMKARDKDLAEKEKAIENLHADIKGLTNKLELQSTKNCELAGVLVKFEERVKARDRKLEEAAAAESALRKELEHKDQTVKQLEKTVLERENRLYHVTGQLEEMKRVQEMVAKLMSSSKAGS